MIDVDGQLDRRRKCISIVLSGGGHSASFLTSEPAAIMWSGRPPCPDWALEAVRAWTKTPEAQELYEELRLLLDAPALADVMQAIESSGGS